MLLKNWCLAIWKHILLSLLRRAGPPFITNSSYQIILHQSGVILVVGSLIEKNSIATKMKGKGWVVDVYEDLSHFPWKWDHHSRVYMYHVCSIQSISARKATHIKLGTCSGSSQCQLHFRLKWCRLNEVAVSGCLLNAHFQAFLRWPPLIVCRMKDASPEWKAKQARFVPRNRYYLILRVIHQSTDQ